MHLARDFTATGLHMLHKGLGNRVGRLPIHDGYVDVYTRWEVIPLEVNGLSLDQGLYVLPVDPKDKDGPPIWQFTNSFQHSSTHAVTGPSVKP